MKSVSYIHDMNVAEAEPPLLILPPAVVLGPWTGPKVVSA